MSKQEEGPLPLKRLLNYDDFEEGPLQGNFKGTTVVVHRPKKEVKRHASLSFSFSLSMISNCLAFFGCISSIPDFLSSTVVASKHDFPVGLTRDGKKNYA